MNISTRWVYLLLFCFGLFSTQLEAQSQKQEVCFNFNDLADGTKFGTEANQKPGTPILKKDGIAVSIESFLTGNNSTEFGSIKVEEKKLLFDGSFKEAEGKVLFVSNVNLKWIFSGLPKKKAKRVSVKLPMPTEPAA